MEPLDPLPGVPTRYDTLFTMDYLRGKVPRLARLYENAKRDQWNAATDIDWSIEVDPAKENFPDAMLPIYGTPLWKELSAEKKLQLRKDGAAWILSQFLHGEQGALLTVAQVVNSVPDYDAKLYASTQTVDEGRHVEVYGRYLQEKARAMMPINPNLHAMLNDILGESRWDMKYLGMQILIEGLALGAFGMIHKTAREPLIKEITHYVMKDESRHVAFGIIALEDVYNAMSREEVRVREAFAYEGCLRMRDRFIAEEIARRNGIPVELWNRQSMNSKLMQEFRRMLFTRIMPCLKRVGLLSDEVKPKFQELGLLKYQDAPLDFADLG
ncbi:MAG: ferritin-like domain-containing protein [Halobacteria archaeon]